MLHIPSRKRAHGSFPRNHRENSAGSGYSPLSGFLRRRKAAPGRAAGDGRAPKAAVRQERDGCEVHSVVAANRRGDGYRITKTVVEGSARNIPRKLNNVGWRDGHQMYAVRTVGSPGLPPITVVRRTS